MNSFEYPETGSKTYHMLVLFGIMIYPFVLLTEKLDDVLWLKTSRGVKK